MHDLDAIEAHAFRDLFAAAPPELARALGLRVLERSGATALVAPGLPSPQFNRVLRLGQAPVPEADLDAFVEAYRAEGVRTWWMQLSPGPGEPRLLEQLEARGFAPAGRAAWTKMQRGRAPLAPAETKAEVRPPRPEELAAVAEAVRVSFDMPPALGPWFAALGARPGWRAVGAFLDGAAVGGAYLYLSGDTGWLGAGGVRREARAQHAHRALMAWRVEQALAAGCAVITTETGQPQGDEVNPSLRNMEATGFSRAFLRRNFAAPG